MDLIILVIFQLIIILLLDLIGKLKDWIWYLDGNLEYREKS